ncbi:MULTISPECIES: hypothetical protein [unclassified Acinetobacter]|uniref:hypothetical protein n=1 Tax=unclassified Acinetobacter TaxID=196816 RepID=UPI001F4B4BC5|nr:MULTISPECIES: hypothetical protein [unclassified Acinetobacter]MCH7352237.1 hypothetical protein [Acinetobacter sp. NIPH 2023]MCH7352246.1 hypothetical protein [Acinetobacter sp. NIPH 2023]MCH7358204.1 hypothetical protein [Acinetobacter sp. NIPH 2024]MCH7358213.1 hypothetical protein [Acinetobacter sp. NIPH 2024]
MSTLLLALIFGIALGYFIYKKNTGTSESLKITVKKAFPKYTIIEKFDTVMVCEINHRNEPDELIFIRIGQAKKIIKEGRRIVATYTKKPTKKILEKDLKKYLK